MIEMQSHDLCSWFEFRVCHIWACIDQASQSRKSLLTVQKWSEWDISAPTFRRKQRFDQLCRLGKWFLSLSTLSSCRRVQAETFRRGQMFSGRLMTANGFKDHLDKNRIICETDCVWCRGEHVRFLQNIISISTERPHSVTLYRNGRKRSCNSDASVRSHDDGSPESDSDLD